MSFNIPYTARKRVVIIGGGFGGLKLAEKLKKSEFQIVLVDKNNYHQFPPLLYQVASSGLEYNSISFPFRKIFQNQKNFFFRLADVQAINPKTRTIQTNIGELEYDYLVIAAGTTTNFFGNRTIEEQALPMKTVEEALIVRDTLLINLEKATTTTDPVEKQALLNIVVVGAGATGVEVSGALSEMKRFVLPKDYPDLGNFRMNIYLIEASAKVLGVMSAEASSHAKRFLEEMGVNVMLDKKVIDYKDKKVKLDDGQEIPTHTLLWVSGVKAVHFDHIEGEMLTRGERIVVNECNQVKGQSSIFAIGDVCYQTEEAFPNGHPQVAQVAIQQGELLAANLRRIEDRKPPLPFLYRNLGSLATIGRNKAVADLNKLKLQGFMAWMVWMLVHLRSILGIKNKLVVLIDWIWNYVTYDRSMRFILFVRKRKQDEIGNTERTL